MKKEDLETQNSQIRLEKKSNTENKLGEKVHPEPPKSQLCMKKKSTGKHVPTSWKIAPPWQDPPAKVICQIDYFEM